MTDDIRRTSWSPEERLLCAGALPWLVPPGPASPLSGPQSKVAAGAEPASAPSPDPALSAALREPLNWGRLVERARREGTACILLKRLLGIVNSELRIENAGAGFSSHSQFNSLNSQFPAQFPPIPPFVWERLKEIRLATLAKNVRLGHRLREIDAALARRGVRAVLLKGAYLARTAYGDPGVRGMGDMDFLVEPAALAEAGAALREAGFVPLGPLPRGVPERGLYLNSVVYGDVWEGASDPDAGGSRAKARSRNSVVKGDVWEGASAPEWGAAFVHLHWHWLNASFPMLPYGARLDADALRASARPLPEFQALEAPAPERALLYLCEHAFKHAYDALIRLVDVVALWRAAGPDPGRVEAAARRWGLERPVGITLDLCGAYFGRACFASTVADGRAASDLARALLDGVPVPRAERMFQKAAFEHRRGRARSYGVYLAWQEGVRGKLGFLARTLFPPREDLRRIEAMDELPGVADYAGRVFRGVRFLLGS